MSYDEKGNLKVESIASIIVSIVVGIIILIGAFTMFETVDTGYRGVVTNLSRVTGEVKGEGFYVLNPFTQNVVEMNVQFQKAEVEASAASKDLQDVTAKIAVNYHLDPSKVAMVYQEMRQDYVERLISPAIQESIKSATAKYTAEELITKRSEVRESIAINLKEKVESRGILVDEVNLVNFSFSESFNTAIENKVRAEQDALASKNQLERIKYEAQQKVEAARGEAESIRIQSQALTEQPQFLDKMAIEKWNGQLPQTMLPGSVLPFLNLK